MPLIDGIGDEVVHFAAVVIVMGVAALAWWSTNARPDRYRTALLMRSHSHHPIMMMRSHAHHPVSVSIRTGAPSTLLYTSRQSIASGQPPTETGPSSSLLYTSRQSTASGQPPTETAPSSSLLHTSRQSTASGQPPNDTVTVTSTTNAAERSTSNNTGNVVPLQEMDSIVDADMALLEHQRLHFYRRINSLHNLQAAFHTLTQETETQEEAEPASNAQIREMDSIVTAMEADVATNVFNTTRGDDANSTALRSRSKKDKKKENSPGDDSTPEENNTEQNPANDNNLQANDKKILIRLKYLNDTLKEVEGSLDELLKDFKWRHFTNELVSEYRVRLIFNGRVLGDNVTLRALGLYDRAVVHCLVHPRRASHQRGGPEARAAPAVLEGGAVRAAPERAWDLENILMTLVSVALTVVWFFRCEYSNMFTASASVALFGLTVFYSVAIFGLYLSDTFHFDRRQPQPVPNN